MKPASIKKRNAPQARTKKHHPKTQSNMERASCITVEWALQETQNILRNAEEEAERIKSMAITELTEAKIKHNAAWSTLTKANQRADEIVRDAFQDADAIRHDANQDAFNMREIAKEEFQRFLSLFKYHVTLMTIQALEDLA